MIIFISIIVIFLCLFKIYTWHNENKNLQKIDQEIKKDTVFEQIEPPPIIETTENTSVPKTDPYWEFINTPFLKVDIQKLQEKNSDIIGWLKVNNTNINYPYVQTQNNTYYLTHDLYKEANGGGWVFLDYRNNRSLNNKNNIIYAHGRENKTMFGTLQNTLKSDWYTNKNNYIIETVSEKESFKWQIFSIYKIPNTSDYIKTNFKTENEYNLFIKKLKKEVSIILTLTLPILVVF